MPLIITTATFLVRNGTAMLLLLFSFILFNFLLTTFLTQINFIYDCKPMLLSKLWCVCMCVCTHFHGQTAGAGTQKWHKLDIDLWMNLSNKLNAEKEKEEDEQLSFCGVKLELLFDFNQQRPQPTIIMNGINHFYYTSFWVEWNCFEYYFWNFYSISKVLHITYIHISPSADSRYVQSFASHREKVDCNLMCGGIILQKRNQIKFIALAASIALPISNSNRTIGSNCKRHKLIIMKHNKR